MVAYFLLKKSVHDMNILLFYHEVVKIIIHLIENN